MSSREIRVDFFTGDASPIDPDSEEEPSVWSIFREHLDVGRAPPKIIRSGQGFELREIHGQDRGRSVWGVVAKLRDEDLPHVGEPGGEERELDIGDKERLIEKNYFLYQRDRKLLVYQRNGNGVTIGQFAAYLAALSEDDVTFNPVLQPEATKRLLKDSVEPKSLELSFTAPKNPEMFPNDEWSRHLLKTMAIGGGQRVYIRMTPGAEGPEDQRRIDKRIKRAVTEIADTGLATVARLDVYEDGVEHPIDLIADRLYSEQQVDMNGRYPIPESMYSALDRATKDCKAELHEILG